MNRMTKTLKAVQQELKSVQAKGDGVGESPLDISSIEKASFLQEEQYSSHGNPLHSTALEEDLSPKVKQNQRSAPVKTGRAAGKTRATNASIRVANALEKTSKENQEPSKPRKQAVSRKVQDGALPTISEHGRDAGKKRASPTNTSQKGQRSEKGTPLTSEENQRSSSEELTDEDESFHPSKEKPKRRRSSSSRRQSGQKHKRKSSSESSERAGPSKKARGSPSDLDVVLNAFHEFVGHFKETVNSDAVNRTIDAFSRSVEEQLSEMITNSKELKNIKRENAKLNSAINQKRSRLLEANNDIIKGKAELTSLQKVHDELEQRLKALREGTSFLNNLQELNRKYLNHRSTHQEEEETYGASCLPAMLLEARCIMGTEQQLKNVNDQLQQIIDETEN